MAKKKAKRPYFWDQISSEERQAWRRASEGLDKFIFDNATKQEGFLRYIRATLAAEDLNYIHRKVLAKLKKSPLNDALLKKQKDISKLLIDKMKEMQQWMRSLGLTPTNEANLRVREKIVKTAAYKLNKRRKAEEPWNVRPVKSNRRNKGHGTKQPAAPIVKEKRRKGSKSRSYTVRGESSED